MAALTDSPVMHTPACSLCDLARTNGRFSFTDLRAQLPSHSTPSLSPFCQPANLVTGACMIVAPVNTTHRNYRRQTLFSFGQPGVRSGPGFVVISIQNGVR